MILFYLGFSRRLPKLLHHTLFFDDGLEETQRTVFEAHTLTKKPAFYVSATSKTDPKVAPPGGEAVFVLVPVSYELIQKEGPSQLTRHFERMLMLVKYAVLQLITKPFLVATGQMTADIFTKAVDEETFFRCKHTLHNTTKESYITRKVSRLSAALARARSMLA